MKSIHMVGIFVAALVLAACASNHGTQAVNDFNRFMGLQAGETTKADVFASFGQPHTVMHIDQTGETVWTYFSVRERTNFSTFIPYVGLVTGGSDLDLTSAAFYFDPDNYFIRSERTQKSRYQNMWLALGDSMTTTGQVDVIRQEMRSLGLPFDEQRARDGAGIADVWANQ